MSEPTNTKALASLRPGDGVDKLAAAIGERWLVPPPVLAGRIDYLLQDFRFSARLDRDGRIGELSFEYGFDPEAGIEGLRMLMPEDDVRQARPDMMISGPFDASTYSFGSLELNESARLHCQISHGRITRLNVYNPNTVFPGKGPMPLALPKTAFEISIVPGLRTRGAHAPDGWCYGLPRGIAPIQWPLSTRSGLPLQHHFTVRVPEQYRVHGEHYVALAFFSATWDDGRADPAIHALMSIIFDGRALPHDTEPALRPLLLHLQNRHPQEFRSQDILFKDFAAIWLTQEEFAGTECEPPEVASVALGGSGLPEWMAMGSACHLFGWDGKEEYNDSYYLHRLAGRRPREKWDVLALELTAVDDDPNTGKQPVDEFMSVVNPDGYIPAYSDAWNALGIERTYRYGHFGGTCLPAQAVPDLTPFFLEFEEAVGGLNLGGGNGQFDLVTMRIDWAQ